MTWNGTAGSHKQAFPPPRARLCVCACLCGRLRQAIISAKHLAVRRNNDNFATAKQAWFAAMVELVDTRDLKSLGQKWLCGFESRSRHKSFFSIVAASALSSTQVPFVLPKRFCTPQFNPPIGILLFSESAGRGVQPRFLSCRQSSGVCLVCVAGVTSGVSDAKTKAKTELLQSSPCVGMRRLERPTPTSRT